MSSSTMNLSWVTEPGAVMDFENGTQCGLERLDYASATITHQHPFFTSPLVSLHKNMSSSEALTVVMLIAFRAGCSRDVVLRCIRQKERSAEVQVGLLNALQKELQLYRTTPDHARRHLEGDISGDMETFSKEIQQLAEKVMELF
jgi:hypothetical protein